MKTIHKYEIERSPNTYGEVRIQARAGADFVSAGLQGSRIVVWAIVDDAAPLVPWGIAVCGTGQPVEPILRSTSFLGTVEQGFYFWHVFDMGPQ